MPRDLFEEQGWSEEEIQQRIAAYRASQKSNDEGSGEVGILQNFANQFVPMNQIVGSTARGALQNISDLGTGIANLGIRGVNAITGADIDRLSPMQYKEGAASPDIADMADFLTAFALPGGNLFKGGKGLAGIGTSALEGGLQGAGYGAAYAAADPDADLKEAAKEGGLLGSVLGGGMRSAAAAPNFFARLFKGDQNQASILRNALSDAAERGVPFESPVMAGEITGSTPLREFTDVISNIPFSGINKAQGRVLGEIEGRANQFMRDIGEQSTPLTASNDLLDIVKDISTKNREKANDLYEGLWQRADAFGKTIPAEGEANKLAKKYIKYINKMDVSLYEDAPGLKKTLNNMAKKKKKSQAKTFSEAHQTRSQLGKLSAKLERKGELPAKRVIDELKAGVSLDMKNAIKGSGGNLYQEYNKINKFYRENVVPYRIKKNKKLYQMITDDIEPINIADTLVNSKDRDFILSHLGEEGRRKLAYGLISKNSKLNPINNEPYITSDALISTFDKKGSQGQKISGLRERLLSENELKELDFISKMNSATKNLRTEKMKVPTGLEGERQFSGATKGALALGGLIYDPIRTGAILGGGAVGGNMLRKYLQSENLLNALEREAFIPTENINKVVGRIARGSTAASREREE